MKKNQRKFYCLFFLYASAIYRAGGRQLLLVKFNYIQNPMHQFLYMLCLEGIINHLAYLVQKRFK